MNQLLDRSVERFGARPLFLRKQDGRFLSTSYAEFGATVAALRAGLSELGVTRGDRVAIIAGNSLEWAAIAYATYGLGAALVPMYESQRESDWKFIVRDSGAKVLFASTPEIFARVSGLSASAPKLRHVACISGSYAAIVEDGRKRSAASSSPARDDAAAILYTSGTTGEPKGVVLTHGNVLSNVLALEDIVQTMGERPEEHRSLSILPWAHAFGHTVELHALVASGASIAIAESLDKIVENIREVRPTVLVAVPTVFMRIHAGIERLIERRPRFVRWLFRRGLALARARERSLAGQALLRLADLLIFSRIRARFGGRLKFAICGAAALPRQTAEFIDAIGITVFEGYGLTECSPIVSANTPSGRKLGSVGRPLPGVRIEIDRSRSQGGESGEIIVYGPNVMQGYHGRDEENRRTFAPGHGLRTGDLGYLDADRFLFVTGRIKEQYKLSNGKYVVPSPLEEQLKLSPFIDNVMICGDNRSYNVALLVPDKNALSELALTLGLADQEPSQLLEHGAIKQLFEREIERVSAEFKSYERIRAFAFSPEAFSQQNGMLTPSLKLKRHEIVRRFGALLDELYPESTHAPLPLEAQPRLTS